MGEHYVRNNSVERWHFREAQNPIKRVNYLIRVIYLVKTALLTTASRLITSILTGLPLRVKGPLQETYVVVQLKTYEKMFPSSRLTN